MWQGDCLPTAHVLEGMEKGTAEKQCEEKLWPHLGLLYYLFLAEEHLFFPEMSH